MVDHLMPLISSPWLYVIVFLIVAVDGFLPVIPSEAIVISLSALTATGTVDLAALFVAVAAGGTAGDQVTYLLGRRAGRRIRNGKLAAAKQKAERAVVRHGGSAILVGRFLPYGRTGSALASGSAAMPLGKYRLFTAMAGAAWAVYAIGLGRLGGAAFADSPILGCLFGMALGFVVAGIHAVVEKRRKATEGRAAVEAMLAETQIQTQNQTQTQTPAVSGPERELVRA